MARPSERSGSRGKKAGREASVGPKAKGESAARRLVFRFAMRFLGLVLLFSTLVRLDISVFDGATISAVNRQGARLVASVMSIVLGASVTIEGDTISYDSTLFTVRTDCTGVDFVGLFIAGMLAFPSPWRDKVRGLLIGVPVLTLLNLIRMVTLIYVGGHWPEALHYGHIYVWPVVVLAAALGLWLHWAGAVIHDRRLVA